MPKEKILITVRTYPTLSEKYQETVCTGGINEAGDWRRLYPVQWRMLDENKQYHQYHVIEATVGENVADGRIESRRIDTSTIRLVDELKDWSSRTQWIRPTVADSLRQFKAAGRTLGPVCVSEVKEFIANPDTAEWTAKQLDMLRQDDLFEGPKPLEKIPFVFRLIWVDGDGEEHDSKFIDWEVCQTWRVYNRKYDNPIERMKDKWMNERFTSKKSILFFMGNYAQHPQHFGVCGTFYPPKEVYNEYSLF